MFLVLFWIFNLINLCTFVIFLYSLLFQELIAFKSRTGFYYFCVHGTDLLAQASPAGTGRIKDELSFFLGSGQRGIGDLSGLDYANHRIDLLYLFHIYFLYGAR
ncbi:hypothetical protein P3X46_032038 [Hevea brasiliensis]|uniref:Uncharacterized protein n=1 Tax=Hevea brasiliensis TaxID=3981 RepID=A0ABQ9KQE6_HEVBR|nr:hypothetical protein P3X46_032038 [Hevea brasiliensis]